MQSSFNIDWEKVGEHLPVDKSKESVAKRNKMFRDFDPNGNGYLSLAELDKGVRDVLKLPEVFALKPVIMRAYQAARKFGQQRDQTAEDFVEKKEFKFFLICLRQYLEYYVMFERLDLTDDK